MKSIFIQCLLSLSLLAIVWNANGQDAYEKVLNKAQEYYQRGDVEKSLVTLEKGIKKMPVEPALYLEGYRICYRESDLENALRYLDRAVTVDKGTEALLYRGYFHYYQRSLELAKADFDLLLTRDPEHLPARLGIVYYLVEKKEIQMAREQLMPLEGRCLSAPSSKERYSFEQLQLVIQDIEYLEADLAFIEELESGRPLSEEAIKASLNYHLKKEQKFDSYKEWSKIFTLLSGQSFVAENNKLWKYPGKSTVVENDVQKEFYITSSLNSNFIIDGQYSGSILSIDMLNPRSSSKIKLPNYDCNIKTIYGYHAYASFRDPSGKIHLLKANLVNGNIEFNTTLLSNESRDLDAIHVTQDHITALTATGGLITLDQSGKVLHQDFWPRLLEHERAPIIEATFSKGGQLLALLTKKNELLLCNLKGKMLRQLQMDQKKWFLEEGLIEVKNILLHPMQQSLLLDTEYGILIWNFQSNEIFMLDQNQKNDTPKKEFKSIYRTGGFDQFTFLDDGKTLVCFQENGRNSARVYFELKEPETENPYLHQAFLQEAKDEYSGKMKNGVPHGYGRMYYANKNIYEGDFFHGLPHGKGIMFYHEGDGYAYEGEWENGKRDGFGILYLYKVADKKQAERYECTWKEGKKHGEGFYVKFNYFGPKDEEGKYKISYIYKGAWENDERHGPAEVYTTSRLSIGSDIHSRYLYRVEYAHGKEISSKLISSDTWLQRLLARSSASGSLNEPPAKDDSQLAAVNTPCASIGGKYGEKIDCNRTFPIYKVKCANGKTRYYYYVPSDKNDYLFCNGEGYHKYDNWGVLGGDMGGFLSKDKEKAMKRLCDCD